MHWNRNSQPRQGLIMVVGHLRHGICVKAAALPRDSLQPSTSGNVPCATWLVCRRGRHAQTNRAEHGAVRQDGRGGMIEFHMGVYPRSPTPIPVHQIGGILLWYPATKATKSQSTTTSKPTTLICAQPSKIHEQIPNHPDISSHPPFQDNSPFRQACKLLGEGDSAGQARPS